MVVETTQKISFYRYYITHKVLSRLIFLYKKVEKFLQNSKVMEESIR